MSRNRDEIEELTAAFQEMSSALDQHLTQLSLLSQAGHHIAARLDQPAVLKAASVAAERLFPVGYVSVSLEGEIVHTSGDNAWAAHRQNQSIRSVLSEALSDSSWRAMGLGGDEGPAGYLCCAAICVGGQLGLIELYGADPVLGDPETGDLLSTLAVQTSIALDNAELYERLAERQAELQGLVERLIDAQEEERRVVAYDIHDGLIQMLVGARLHLRNFAADRSRDPKRAESALQKGVDELGAAIVEARRVIEGLRPAALDDLGLVTILRQLVEETRAACRCELEFEANLVDGRLPSTLETTVYRIVQEAVTNARKYANMSKLRVALEQKNGFLEVEVRDWGRGFDQHQVADGRGVGLVGMNERARLLGGQCSIVSDLGKGTTVRAKIPLVRIEELKE